MNELYHNISFMVRLVAVAVLFVVMFGSLLQAGHTYLKAHSSSCNHFLVVAEIKGSDMCCDDAFHNFDWVCVGAFDFWSKLLSSWGAWVLPLVPTALTAINDVIVTRQVHLGSLRNRLCFFLLLFSFRTFVLYKCAGVIELSLQSSSPSSTCWYSSNRGCKASFDFSDHIVLFIVHYLVPTGLEVVYIASRLSSKTQHDGDKQEVYSPLRQHDTDNGTKHSSGMISCASEKRTLEKNWRLYFPSLLCCAVVWVFALRAMLFTCIYFHTWSENTVAVLLSFVCVLFPIYVCSIQKRIVVFQCMGIVDY